MKAVKISEFKARLAKYIRLVKGGEELEILDRGNPVARVTMASGRSKLEIQPPQKPSEGLAKLSSKISTPFSGEVMDLLTEERRRR